MTARLAPQRRDPRLARARSPRRRPARELARRLLPATRGRRGAGAGGSGDRYAVAGAAPPYRIPAFAVDHHPAEIGVPTGHLRGGAHGYTCFFTECFLDELAHAARDRAAVVPHRHARRRRRGWRAACRPRRRWAAGRAASPGSGQGIACHAFRGSYIAVMAEAQHRRGRARSASTGWSRRSIAGGMINPDLVRQQIEGGLIFGLAAGARRGDRLHRRTSPTRAASATLGLPRLADTPDITVELIRSEARARRGRANSACPPVAPAIANALHAATG